MVSTDWMRELLSLPLDSKGFFDLAHETVVRGSFAQQCVALRLIGQAIDEPDEDVTAEMIHDYLEITNEENEP